MELITFRYCWIKYDKTNYEIFEIWTLEKEMNREEDLNKLLEMLLTKKNFETLLNKMTEEIDSKAKQVRLKPYERTKLILQVNEIMNHKKS